MTAALSPQAREDALDAMAAEELDVLVVGGGVVGTGTALDAVSRGLSTGLLEQRDYGSGTSSRSSKLIHGGLRYLEQLEFGLVHEALTERGLLATRLAPHLVRPVPILVPLPAARGAAGLVGRAWRRGYYGAGVAAYDAFAGRGGGEDRAHGGAGEARQPADQGDEDRLGRCRVPPRRGQPARGSGPLDPLIGSSDWRLGEPEKAIQRLSPVYEAVERIRAAISPDVALIGFAGCADQPPCNGNLAFEHRPHDRRVAPLVLRARIGARLDELLYGAQMAVICRKDQRRVPLRRRSSG